MARRRITSSRAKVERPELAPGEAGLLALEAYRRRKSLEADQRSQRQYRVSCKEDEIGRQVIKRNVRLGAAPSADLIKTFLKDSGFRQAQRCQDWIEVWQKVVGPELAEQTAPVKYANGTLTVDVTSAALKSELENFHRQELVASLQNGPAVLRTIAFRLKA